jgi:ERCC4-type nuclease
LGFALKVRKLTDSLIVLVEQGKKTPQLNDSLTEVLASIQGAGERTSVKSLRDRGAFGHYENVVTMNEVVSATDKGDLIKKLQDVLSSETEQERNKSAVEAIQFFDALERRALYHYSHPPVRRRTAASR